MASKRKRPSVAKQQEGTTKDVSGARVDISRDAVQINAKAGSELRLTTDSESVKKGKSTTITVGEGSLIRLAAGSTVTSVDVADIKPKKFDLGGALVAAIAVAVVLVLAVVASFNEEYGPWIAGASGFATLVAIFVKEASAALSKDAGLSKKSIDNLTIVSATAQIYVVAFGAPAAVWTTIRLVSAIAEATK